MSDYKNFLLRQLGIKEGQIPASSIDRNEFPGIDPQEESPETQPTPREKMMSPTAIATPVIGIAVRGSVTGGLPSGREISPSKLGGYAPVQTGKENSEIYNKTPKNSEISSAGPISSNGGTQPSGGEHPHQVQNDAGEPPQATTGASTDSDPSLKLKDAAPKEIDVDVAECGCDDEHGSDEENNGNNPEFQKKDQEQFRKDRSASPEGDEVRKSMNEGKHKIGCKCGFCSNKKRFGKKDKSDSESKDSEKDNDEKDQMDEQSQKVPTKRLQEIRGSLQEKAISGKMNKKESELFSTITEVLRKRESEIVTPMFSTPSGNSSGRMVYNESKDKVDDKIAKMKSEKDAQKARRDHKKNQEKLDKEIRRDDLR